MGPPLPSSPHGEATDWLASLGYYQARLATYFTLSRDQVEIMRKCLTDRPIADLMAVTDRTNRTKFRDQVLKSMLADGLLEMTVPDKPTSSKQRYRLSDKGRNLLASLKEGGA